MKTTLPPDIMTIIEAKKFLTELYNNGESFHPQDDATLIDWDCEPPTKEEADQLNILMYDIYQIGVSLFDPCEYLLLLDPEYRVNLKNADPEGYKCDCLKYGIVDTFIIADEKTGKYFSLLGSGHFTKNKEIAQRFDSEIDVMLCIEQCIDGIEDYEKFNSFEPVIKLL